MHSNVSIDAGQDIGALKFTIGSVERSLTYSAGKMVFPAIPAQFDLTLREFEWLVTEAEKFVELVVRLLKPQFMRDGLFAVYFDIGAKQGSLWNAAVTATFNNLDDPPVNPTPIAFVGLPAGNGAVRFMPRPQITVVWPSFQMLNRLSRELLYAVNEGERPRGTVTESVSTTEKRTWNET